MQIQVDNKIIGVKEQIIALRNSVRTRKEKKIYSNTLHFIKYIEAILIWDNGSIMLKSENLGKFKK
jgi:hypothetical protein